MNDLLDLQDKIQDTSAAIAQVERAFVRDPESPSLKIMAESLEKRRHRLEGQFLAESARVGIDVLRNYVLHKPTKSG